MTEKAKTLAQKITRRIRRNPYREVSEITPLFIRAKLPNDYAATISEPSMKICDSDECATNPWTRSANSNPLLFLLRWPITFLLWCTVPDSRRFKRCYILTFINCVVWIGGISYFVVFLTTDVGERDFSDRICFVMTRKIVPDTVMGLTFLAAGTSVPEAVSSVIITAQGHGSMGISNTIGSNIFDILLCLGLPWLIKTLLVPTISGEPWVSRSTINQSFSLTLKSTDHAQLNGHRVLNGLAVRHTHPTVLGARDQPIQAR